MVQYLKNEISSDKDELAGIEVDLEKGQEEVEKPTFTVNANINKQMRLRTKMAKDAKAQAKHA